MSNWKRHFAVATLGAVALVLGPLAFADAWSDAAALLARDIAGITGPGTVALSLKNASSLPGADVAPIRHALEAHLLAAGVHLAEANTAASEVEVTLSENLEGYLWAASIRQGTETHAVMEAVPRTQAPATTDPGSSVLLRKTLLYSQESLILDVATIDGGRLLVLDPERVSLLRGSPGNWKIDEALTVMHTRPFPRDVRGRLDAGGGRLFQAYLPGAVCSATSVAPLSMSCRDTDDPWPLQPANRQAAAFGPARNFFTGGLVPALGKQADTAPFYAAAALPRLNYTLWLFAGVDGRVRAADGVNEVVLDGAVHWGSDIAAVKSGCGTIVLADADHDNTENDTIRAYEVGDREPAPSSPPLEFPGPVTALWNSNQEGAATAVVHNLRINQYEAYSLVVVCP
jgi:hypothetical protein